MVRWSEDVGAVTCSLPGGGRKARGGRTQGRIIFLFFFFFIFFFLWSVLVSPLDKSRIVWCVISSPAAIQPGTVWALPPPPLPRAQIAPCSSCLYHPGLPFQVFSHPFIAVQKKALEPHKGGAEQAGGIPLNTRRVSLQSHGGGGKLGELWHQEQVQPLSDGQGGSWLCVLCIPDSLNVKSAVFSDPSPGTATGPGHERGESELGSTGCSC